MSGQCATKPSSEFIERLRWETTNGKPAFLPRNNPVLPVITVSLTGMWMLLPGVKGGKFTIQIDYLSFKYLQNGRNGTCLMITELWGVETLRECVVIFGVNLEFTIFEGCIFNHAFTFEVSGFFSLFFWGGGEVYMGLSQ